MKKCSQCGNEKTDNNYYPKKNVCKECYCRNCKEWRQNNKEKTRGYCKEHYWKDPDKARKRVSDWRKRNPDTKREANKKWISANIEKYKDMINNWRRKNKEIILQSKRLSNSKRRSASKDKIEIKEWNSVLEFYGNKCLCCGRKDLQLTIDHIIPLSKGGKNLIDNVQPLCMPCNAKKGTKTIDYRRGHQE